AGKAGDHDVLRQISRGGDTVLGNKGNVRKFCTRALWKRCKRLANKPSKKHSAGGKTACVDRSAHGGLDSHGGLDGLVKRDVEYTCSRSLRRTRAPSTTSRRQRGPWAKLRGALRVFVAAAVSGRSFAVKELNPVIDAWHSNEGGEEHLESSATKAGWALTG
ncbi:unnamed protein product, partial [Symbiodinium sp. CCMP2456]